MALAAQKLGLHRFVTMFVPMETRKNKIDNLENLGAEVWCFDDPKTDKDKDYELGDDWIRRCAKIGDFTYVPAFDHEHVIAGQGTVGLEILQQMASPPHAIFVPVGGGD